MKKLACLAAGLAVLAAACGDDEELGNVDARPPTDAGLDADVDAPIDAPSPFVPPTPFAIPLSAMGPDQIMSVAAGPAGSFYLAGFAAATPTGPRLLTVVKTTTTGPDATFGTGGVFTSALEFRGGSTEIDLVVQPDGKLVVSGTVASATNPMDRDVAFLRLNANGTLDATFGDAGVRVLDLSTAHDNGTALVGFDGARALAVGPAGELYLLASSRGEGTAMAGGPRTDTDFTVVKLSASGTQDLTFAGDGKYTLDIQESGATPHWIGVVDGGVLIGGYANSSGIGSVQPVLFKLTTAGAPITTFATDGLFHEQVLALQTEIYGIAVHGNTFITGGYGRDTGTTNDYVSMKFDTTTGVRDTTFGPLEGSVVFDPSGANLGDNCRGALALPGGKTLLIGSTGPGNDPAQDAVFAVLTPTGALDTTYGTGINRFTLGTGSEQFWGAAVSGTNVLIAGWRGAGATQTAATNDDAFGIILPLR